MHYYRLSNWLYRHHFRLIPKFLYYIQYLLFNSSVPASCEIGKRTKFGYGGIAVIIHKRAKIGKECIIGSCVTIGGKSGWYEVPVIGNNVEISTGAKVLGPVIVGNNVIIGANAVVVKDVPDNCIVAGCPAKIIRKLDNDDPLKSRDVRYRGDKEFPVTEFQKEQ
ncbi:MAG: serine acetyltransferase [Bacteroidales bacterium]|nr:serine acetyltransferase [Bacteroidales bacterium]